jgi:hypothetical protein
VPILFQVTAAIALLSLIPLIFIKQEEPTPQQITSPSIAPVGEAPIPLAEIAEIEKEE